MLERRSFFLVGERAGRVVATGGVHYFERRNIATLCFGLVHPDFQGKGIGIALVLTRLALLRPTEPGFWILIFALSPQAGRGNESATSPCISMLGRLPCRAFHT